MNNSYEFYSRNFKKEDDKQEESDKKDEEVCVSV